MVPHFCNSKNEKLFFTVQHEGSYPWLVTQNTDQQKENKEEKFKIR